MEILNSCTDCDEIQFKEDGSWAPMRSKKEVQEVSSASYNNGLDGETCHGVTGGRSVGEGKTQRLLRYKSSKGRLEVITLGLKRLGKKREDVRPLPLCVYEVSVLIW